MKKLEKILMLFHLQKVFSLRKKKRIMKKIKKRKRSLKNNDDYIPIIISMYLFFSYSKI